MEPEGSLLSSLDPTTCPYPEPHQFSPAHHPTSRSSILILSLHLRHSLSSGLFPSVFPIKTLYAPLSLPHTCYMSHLSHYFWSPNWYLMRTAVHKAPHSIVFSTVLFVTLSILIWNVFLSTVFLNTLSLCFSFNVRDQVSCSHKLMGKIIVLCSLIFIFLL